MSDPFSVITAVVGLVATSAHLGRRSKELYDSAKVAPASMLQLQTEMENIHLIFIQVEMFVRGVTKKNPSKKGLTLISLHHLMAILTGCVLVLSSIDKKLSEVAGLMDPTTKKPIRNLPCTIDRIKWALWKESEIGVMLQELERHKTSLNLMLSLIQCNSASEANTSLENLHALIDEISESNHPTSVQLRVLISRVHDEEGSISGPSTFKNISDTTSNSASFSIGSSSTSGSCTSFHRAQSDNTSIFTTHSIQSLTTALFSSRAYKKLRHRRSGSGADSGAASFLSLDSSATKGDRWSMLSDISLGQLSISEIAVLELPIGLSDVYDPQLYEFAMKMNLEDQVKEHSRGDQGAGWSSRGRVHNAIRTKSDFALRTMINLGVDIEETDSKGRTPLWLAAREGNLEACRLLLEKGAAVNIPDSSGRTLLSHAAASENLDLCTLLVDKGAAVNTPDSSGQTPLSYAAASGNLNICTLLVGKGAAVDTPDSSGRTPLYYVDSLAVCQLLVEKGAEVNTHDSTGCTPLSYAAAEYKWDICQLLVEKGAEVNTPDSIGCTPLSHAASEHKWDICQLLVEKGAEVNITDSSGRTLLSHAAVKGLYSGTLDICKFLVDNGAAVDAPDSSGRTPLSYAAGNSYHNSTLQICEFLVDKGAAVDAPDSCGRTPLSYAAADGSRYSSVVICKFLVDKGAAVDAPDSSGRTPLSHATATTKNYSLDICKFLVDKGAAVNHTDSSGFSPYWYARSAPNRAVCRFLSEKGAK